MASWLKKCIYYLSLVAQSRDMVLPSSGVRGRVSRCQSPADRVWNSGSQTQSITLPAEQQLHELIYLQWHIWQGWKLKSIGQFPVLYESKL